nr:homeobox protein knotted-1-like 6 [Ipomoea trifida]
MHDKLRQRASQIRGSDNLTATVISEAASVAPDIYRRGGGGRLEEATREKEDDYSIGLIKVKIASHPSYPKRAFRGVY